MKIVVTGCAGFIGSNFLKRLFKYEPDHNIINIDNLTYAGNLKSIEDLLNHPNHKFVKGDIADSNLVNKEIPDDTEMIINFAAESHVDRSIVNPRAFMETNVTGTFNLLEKAKNLNIRFVQVSTDEVYGSLGTDGLFTEKTPLAPNSPYSASKASADLLVRSYNKTFGLSTVITRCSNNYGPYQFPEKLIPLMIKNALEDKALPVYGDGLNVRDWLHVDDHANGIWTAALSGQPGDIYNFGGNCEKSNIDVVKLLLKYLEKPESLIQYVKDRPGHDRRYAMDFSKAEKELGWKPKINFEDGLHSTIQWYKSNQPWVQSVVTGDYKNFYDQWYGRR
jgi:dTDP-glucose 4,6-dehydratase